MGPAQPSVKTEIAGATARAALWTPTILYYTILSSARARARAAAAAAAAAGPSGEGGAGDVLVRRPRDQGPLQEQEQEEEEAEEDRHACAPPRLLGLTGRRREDRRIVVRRGPTGSTASRSSCRRAATPSTGASSARTLVPSPSAPCTAGSTSAFQLLSRTGLLRDMSRAPSRRGAAAQRSSSPEHAEPSATTATPSNSEQPSSPATPAGAKSLPSSSSDTRSTPARKTRKSHSTSQSYSAGPKHRQAATAPAGKEQTPQHSPSIATPSLEAIAALLEVETALKRRL